MPIATAKLRIRVLLAMLLLALPLGVAVWAFASFAGRSAEQRASEDAERELRDAAAALRSDLT